MAAYPALVSLTRLVDQLLHYDQQYFPIPQINDEEEQQFLKSLHEKLSLLLDFLENHSRNSSVEKSDSLEARIRDAAYHVEDLIETHISNQIPSEYADDRQQGSKSTSRKSVSASPKTAIPSKYGDDKRVGFRRTFRQWASSFKKVILPRKQGDSNITGLRVNLFKDKEEDLQKMMEEIDSIVEETKKISTSSQDHLRSIIDSSRQEAPGSKRMVGFDDDSMKIKEWLCGESSSLKIVSIVGMGGTGKTTLAKSIFDDSLVAYHFHTRAWVTISQEYYLRDILLALLASCIEKTGDLKKWDDEELKECVYKSLKGRRYLIVMDDMWGTDVWDDFRMILPDDYNGSRVILTTRLEDVAVYVDDSRSHLHQMKFLDEDESWNLLKEKVFVEESCPREIEIIGRKIASKCGGLPLALVLVGGLLTKAALKTPNDWENFAENVSSSLAADGDEHFSKIMSLSYDHLPHHLKPCFLYVGGFPEDYEIPVFKLLQLWIAEGFVRPSKSVEQVAEEYLEDLAKRNLVLITKKSSTGKFRLCRIHDLLRDFCISKAQDENLFHVNKHLLRKDTENKRRLFLSRQNTWNLYKVLGNATGLEVRSIIFSTHYFKTELPTLVAASKLLRVFEGLEVEMSSSTIHQVTELCHLRYLSFLLSANEKFMLPASISRLRNLQTLIIRASPSVSLPQIHLPIEIWTMPQLRHIIVHDECFLPNPRAGAKASILENLQTLSRIVDFTFRTKCIEKIPNLKKLGVIYTEWYSSIHGSKYHLHNLVHLNQLESLNLNIHSIGVNDFPVNFAFPPTLRKLALRGCAFPWEKMTAVGSLPNLEVLKLKFNAFKGEEWVTVEGEFARLKFLLMDSIALAFWQTENSHFPILEQLVIRKCPDLEEIPSGIGDIQTLQVIEVDSDSKSAVDSAMRIKEEQRDMGNDYLQVRVIPNKSKENYRVKTNYTRPTYPSVAPPDLSNFQASCDITGGPSKEQLYVFESNESGEESRHSSLVNSVSSYATYSDERLFEKLPPFNFQASCDVTDGPPKGHLYVFGSSESGGWSPHSSSISSVASYATHSDERLIELTKALDAYASTSRFEEDARSSDDESVRRLELAMEESKKDLDVFGSSESGEGSRHSSSISSVPAYDEHSDERLVELKKALDEMCVGTTRFEENARIDDDENVRRFELAMEESNVFGSESEEESEYTSAISLIPANATDSDERLVELTKTLDEMCVSTIRLEEDARRREEKNARRFGLAMEESENHLYVFGSSESREGSRYSSSISLVSSCAPQSDERLVELTKALAEMCVTTPRLEEDARRREKENVRRFELVMEETKRREEESKNIEEMLQVMVYKMLREVGYTNHQFAGSSGPQEQDHLDGEK